MISMNIPNISSGQAGAPTTNIAFLALHETELVGVELFKHQLQVIFGEQSSKILDVTSGEKTLTVNFGKNFCVLALLDGPIPWEDLEWPCATSWRWREATSQMKKHTAHLMVSIIGSDGSTIERMLLLTKVLAAATAASHHSVGIYWGRSSLVHEPIQFIEEAKSADLQDLPIMLWIKFYIQQHPAQSFSVITIGLEAFERMEIEILESMTPLADMMDIAIGTAWLLLQGESIADGDTVGPNPKAGIQVKYENSIWERPGKVLQIQM